MFTLHYPKKSVPLQARGAQRVPGSYGSQITSQWPGMVVRLSGLRIGRFLLPGNTPGTLLEAESTPRPQCDRKDYVDEKFR